jgi:hypothetical protein
MTLTEMTAVAAKRTVGYVGRMTEKGRLRSVTYPECRRSPRNVCYSRTHQSQIGQERPFDIVTKSRSYSSTHCVI